MTHDERAARQREVGEANEVGRQGVAWAVRGGAALRGRAASMITRLSGKGVSETTLHRGGNFAAIHQDILAGHERRSVAGQERDESR